MKIYELTDEQMEKIAKVNPEWMAVHRPEWMVTYPFKDVPDDILKIIEE